MSGTTGTSPRPVPATAAHFPRDDRPADERSALQMFLEEQRAALLRNLDGLDTPDLGSPSDVGLSRRWVLLHLIEEQARHAGHAGIIRESIDGTTGA